MPNLKQMLDFVTSDPLVWSAFLAIPVILFCIACLLPRGKGNVLVLVERIAIIVGIVAVLGVPFILEMINPDILGFDAFDTIVKYGLVHTTVIVALLVVLVLGIFTGRSYLTQALYGMISCVSMPYGLVNLLFPNWASASNIVDVFKNPDDLWHFLVYAACFFVPIWLIRSGEYKFRVSSVWHLISAFGIGGCALTFLVETRLFGAYSHSVYRVLHLFDDVKSFADLKEFDFSLLLTIAGVVAVFFVVVIIAGLGVSIVRVVLKTGDRLFVSESFGGLVIRTVGNVVANGICVAGILVLPLLVNHTASFPLALVYLVPIVLYFIIILASAFFADMVEIKRGIKRANEELAREAAIEAISASMA